MTDDPICSACNGSGEGQHDGTRCYKCHGRGVEPVEHDDGNADELFERDREDRMFGE
jgi:DnaJ-class molecular chaperone